jgi:hypothetical protein
VEGYEVFPDGKNLLLLERADRAELATLSVRPLDRLTQQVISISLSLELATYAARSQATLIKPPENSPRSARASKSIIAARAALGLSSTIRSSSSNGVGCFLAEPGDPLVELSGDRVRKAVPRPAVARRASGQRSRPARRR